MALCLVCTVGLGTTVVICQSYSESRSVFKGLSTTLACYCSDHFYCYDNPVHHIVMTKSPDELAPFSTIGKGSWVFTFRNSYRLMS